MAKVRREVKGETKCLESLLAEESTSSSSYLMSKVLSYTVMHNFQIHSLDVSAVSRDPFVVMKYSFNDIRIYSACIIGLPYFCN